MSRRLQPSILVNARWRCHFLIAWVLLLLLARVPLAHGQAQNIDTCYPLRVSSAEIVSQVLGLSEIAQSGLEKALRRRELRVPSDLYRLPDFTASQRDGLESLLCWSRNADTEAQMALRSRGEDTEFDAGVFSGWSWGGFSLRRRGDEHRGGVWLQGKSVDVALGTLRQHHGLGLVLGNDTASRNPFSRLQARPHRPTTGMHLAAEPALSVRLERKAWGLHGGTRQQEDMGPRSFAAMERRVAEGTVGGLFLVQGDAEAMSLYGTKRFGPTRVDAELARVGKGQAWLARVQHHQTTWSLLGSWSWQGPLVGLLESKVSQSPEWLSYWEIRSRGSQGWRLRYRLHSELGERDTRVEGEATETFGPWRGTLLLRRDRALESELLLRSDLRWTNPQWEWRFRYEEHLEASDAQLFTIDLTHRKTPRFRIRFANAAKDDPGPTLWWYRRRAGGVYGWNTLPPGVWGGIWCELGWGPLLTEVSIDSHAQGTDAVLALRLR